MMTIISISLNPFVFENLPINFVLPLIYGLEKITTTLSAIVLVVADLALLQLAILAICKLQRYDPTNLHLCQNYDATDYACGECSVRAFHPEALSGIIMLYLRA